MNQKNTFLNLYHIQGADKSQISIGAYHPDYPKQLIAVMTFAKPRAMMGRTNKDDGKWELSRFATDKSYTIPGIASKLLKHFVRIYTPKMVYSYADARWSVGNLYEKIGFTLHKHNKPSYCYVIDGLRKHRWAFRKDVIREKYLNVYDVSKTEYQMMLELGIDRVWDAGTLLYIKDY